MTEHPEDPREIIGSKYNTPAKIAKRILEIFFGPSHFSLGLWELFEELLPSRQIYHRSKGQVRYFNIGTLMQAALGGFAILITSLALTAVVALIDANIDGRENRSALQRIFGTADTVLLTEEVQTTVEVTNLGDALNYIDGYADRVAAEVFRREAELASLREEVERLEIASSLTPEQAGTVLALLQEDNADKAAARIWENALFLGLGVAGSFLVGLFFFVAQRWEKPPTALVGPTAPKVKPEAGKDKPSPRRKPKPPPASPK